MENKEEIQTEGVRGKESKVSLYDRKVKVMFYLSAFFIIIGFYKRFVYNYSKYSSSINLNAYVGGDAYNFIISSNQMVAYFVLALICVVIACTFMIVNAISAAQNPKLLIK